uniref:Glutamyl aminopeptidase n=1 Tax=Anoplophora glabripennis TaxID=217634 RepID=V5GPU2_ANOGL
MQNESIVRSQDYWTVMGYISTNTAGTSLVWDWVRANWEYLVERFTLNNRYLGSFIPTITSSFATQERLTEMQEFFALYPDAGAGTANRAKALETVENNIRWLASYKTTVETWIAAQASTA